jgi:hypothetical protein
MGNHHEVKNDDGEQSGRKVLDGNRQPATKTVDEKEDVLNS